MFNNHNKWTNSNFSTSARICHEISKERSKEKRASPTEADRHKIGY